MSLLPSLVHSVVLPAARPGAGREDEGVFGKGADELVSTVFMNVRVLLSFRQPTLHRFTNVTIFSCMVCVLLKRVALCCVSNKLLKCRLLKSLLDHPVNYLYRHRSGAVAAGMPRFLPRANHACNLPIGPSCMGLTIISTTFVSTNNNN